MLHINVRSLIPKPDQVKIDICHPADTQIVSISETWLKPSIQSDMLYIEEYELHRFDRNGSSCKKSGGGLCTYVRSDINANSLAYKPVRLKTDDCQWQPMTTNDDRWHPALQAYPAKYN